MAARTSARERALRVYLEHSLSSAQVSLFAAERSRRFAVDEYSSTEAVVAAKRVITVLNDCLHYETRGCLLLIGLGHLMALDRYQEVYLCARRAVQDSDTTPEQCDRLQGGLYCVSGQSLINASIALACRDAVLSAMWELSAHLSYTVATAPVVTKSHSEICTHYEHMDLLKQLESEAARCLLIKDGAREAGYYRLAAALECRAWASSVIHSILRAYKHMFPWNGDALIELYSGKYIDVRSFVDKVVTAAGYAAALRVETHPVVRSLLSEGLRLVDVACQQHMDSENPSAPPTAEIDVYICDLAETVAGAGLALRAAITARDKAHTEFQSSVTADAAAALRSLDERLLRVTQELRDISPCRENKAALMALCSSAQRLRKGIETVWPSLVLFAEEAAAACRKSGTVYPLIARSWERAAAHVKVILELSGDKNRYSELRTRLHRGCCQAYVDLATRVYAGAAESTEKAARSSGQDKEVHEGVSFAYLRAGERIEDALLTYAAQETDLDPHRFQRGFEMPGRAQLDISIARRLSSALSGLLGHRTASDNAMNRLSIAACHLRLRLPTFLWEAACFLEPGNATVFGELAKGAQFLVQRVAELLDATVNAPIGAPGITGHGLHNVRDDATHLSSLTWLAEAVRALVRLVVPLTADRNERRAQKLLVIVRYCESVCHQLVFSNVSAPATVAVSEADDSQSEYSEVEEDEGEVDEVVNEESEVNETGMYETTAEVPLVERLTRLKRTVDNLLQAYRAMDLNQAAVFTAAAELLKLDDEIVVDSYGVSEMLQSGGGGGAAVNRPLRVREATLRDATLYVSFQLSTLAHRMDEPDYKPEDEDDSFPYSQRLPDGLQEKLDNIVAVVVTKALARATEEVAAEASGGAVVDQTTQQLPVSSVT